MAFLLWIINIVCISDTHQRLLIRLHQILFWKNAQSMTHQPNRASVRERRVSLIDQDHYSMRYLIVDQMLHKCSVCTALLFFKNCFIVKLSGKIYFFFKLQNQYFLNPYLNNLCISWVPISSFARVFVIFTLFFYFKPRY